MTRQAALSAYRNALRSTKMAFGADKEILLAARTQIRAGYAEDKNLAQEAAQEKIEHLNSVAKFLLENIVQGSRQEDGQYLLNIHEKTELGDNETIKQKKTDMGSLAGAKATKRCS